MYIERARIDELGIKTKRRGYKHFAPLVLVWFGHSNRRP